MTENGDAQVSELFTVISPGCASFRAELKVPFKFLNLNWDMNWEFKEVGLEWIEIRRNSHNSN